jgi:hypothetical protein
MSNLTQAARPPAMSTESRRGERQPPDRLHDEDVRLLTRLTRLRLGLENMLAENARLRRKVAELELQNRSLKSTGRPVTTPRDHAERVRSMLRDRGSQNP